MNLQLFLLFVLQDRIGSLSVNFEFILSAALLEKVGDIVSFRYGAMVLIGKKRGQKIPNLFSDCQNGIGMLFTGFYNLEGIQVTYFLK